MLKVLKYSGTSKSKYKSDLEVTLDANYRSATCFIGETDHDDNQCTKCNEVQERALPLIQPKISIRMETCILLII